MVAGQTKHALSLGLTQGGKPPVARAPSTDLQEAQAFAASVPNPWNLVHAFRSWMLASEESIWQASEPYLAPCRQQDRQTGVATAMREPQRG